MKGQWDLFFDFLGWVECPELEFRGTLELILVRAPMLRRSGSGPAWESNTCATCSMG